MTCFWQARACHVATLLLIAVVSLLTPSPFWPFAAVAGSFSWMYGTMVWGWYTRMERHYEVSPEVAHPTTLQWREGHGAERLMMLLGIPSMVAYGLWHLSGPERFAIGFAFALCFWLAAQYLQCCIPLPPGAHREWLAERERARTLAAAEAFGQHSPVR